MNSSFDVATLHSSIFREFSEKYDISLVILFGSRAKGTARAESDIDLAVFLGDVVRPYTVEKKKVREIADRLYNDLALRLETSNVDLLILNYSDPFVWYEVSRHGRLLFEREAGNYRTFCIRALQRHNDARRFYEAEKRYLMRFAGGDGNG
ncbi:hypothetical protein BSNK01_30840 [Bacillaceae bacterium]